MDNFKDACVRYAPYIGTGLLAVGTTVFLFRRLRARKPRFVHLVQFRSSFLTLKQHCLIDSTNNSLVDKILNQQAHHSIVCSNESRLRGFKKIHAQLS